MLSVAPNHSLTLADNLSVRFRRCELQSDGQFPVWEYGYHIIMGEYIVGRHILENQNCAIEQRLQVLNLQSSQKVDFLLPQLSRDQSA